MVFLQSLWICHLRDFWKHPILVHASLLQLAVQKAATLPGNGLSPLPSCFIGTSGVTVLLRTVWTKKIEKAKQKQKATGQNQSLEKLCVIAKPLAHMAHGLPEALIRLAIPLFQPLCVVLGWFLKLYGFVSGKVFFDLAFSLNAEGKMQRSFAPWVSNAVVVGLMKEGTLWSNRFINRCQSIKYNYNTEKKKISCSSSWVGQGFKFGIS